MWLYRALDMVSGFYRALDMVSVWIYLYGFGNSPKFIQGGAPNMMFVGLVSSVQSSSKYHILPHTHTLTNHIILLVMFTNLANELGHHFVECCG